jgi:hypothetical protein
MYFHIIYKPNFVYDGALSYVQRPMLLEEGFLCLVAHPLGLFSSQNHATPQGKRDKDMKPKIA